MGDTILDYHCANAYFAPMPKTRDVAKATLDRWVQYLENPDNRRGKTADELASKLLDDFHSWFRKSGRPPPWWGTEEQRLETMGDVRRAWEDELEKQGEARTAWKNGKYPTARRAAYLVHEKYPQKYPDPKKLARQFQYYFRSRLRFDRRKI